VNCYERFVAGVTTDTVDFLRSQNYEIDAEGVARVVCGHLFPELASDPDSWRMRVAELKRIVELYLQPVAGPSGEPPDRRQAAN
jgi:hypothetical protein